MNNKSSFCALYCPFFIASSTTTYQLYATINDFKLSVQWFKKGQNDKRSRLKCLLATAGGFNAFYNVFFFCQFENEISKDITTQLSEIFHGKLCKSFLQHFMFDIKLCSYSRPLVMKMRLRKTETSSQLSNIIYNIS